MKYSDIIKSCLLLLVSFFSLGINAQDEEVLPSNAQIGVKGFLSIPVADFKAKQPYTGVGWNVFFLYKVRPPFSIGLDVMWHSYDEETFNFFEFDNDGFEIFIEEKTRNEILTISSFVHVEPKLNFFAFPYLEGYFGYTRYFTNTTFTDLDNDTRLNINKDLSDWALSYGAAAGIYIKLFSEHLLLDLKCRYEKTNTIEFYARNPAANFNIPIDNFEKKRGIPNLIIPQLGITLTLPKGVKNEQE